MRVCRGAPSCAPETTRIKLVMIKRAHAEVRPYRLIVPVVLHFRLLVAYFLLLVARLCRFHSEAEKELGRSGGDCLFIILLGADYAENTGKDSPPMQGRG